MIPTAILPAAPSMSGALLQVFSTELQNVLFFVSAASVYFEERKPPWK